MRRTEGWRPRWCRTGDAGLRRPADVAMMQTADFRNLYDRAHLRPLDWPPIRRILLEREVSACPVIVQRGRMRRRCERRRLAAYPWDIIGR